MDSKHMPYFWHRFAVIAWVAICTGVSAYLVISDAIVQHYWDVQINRIPLFFSPGRPLSPPDVSFFFNLTVLLAWCAALLELLKSPRPLVLRLAAGIGLGVLFLLAALFPQVLGWSVTWSTRVSSWGLQLVVSGIRWNTLTRAILFVASSSLFALLAALLHSGYSRIAAKKRPKRKPPIAPRSDGNSSLRGE